MEGARKKILIIEDEEDVIDALTTLLESKDYELFSATDGIRGIETTHKQAVDLVILDIGIPAGSGFFVLESLKNNPRSRMIPVIVITGKIEGDTEQKVYDLGAKAFLRKPFDSEELLSWVEKFLKP